MILVKVHVEAHVKSFIKASLVYNKHNFYSSENHNSNIPHFKQCFSSHPNHYFVLGTLCMSLSTKLEDGK